MTHYFFTRHGESQANVDQVFAGVMDSPLTDKGRADAAIEGQRLRADGLTFDLIISSPLTRAKETAEILARAVRYSTDAIIVDSCLVERSFGILAGKPWSTIEDETATTISDMGGESIDEFAQRVKLALAWIAQASIGKQSVLIVGHGSWYQMAESLLMGKAANDFLEAKSLPNNVVVDFPLT